MSIYRRKNRGGKPSRFLTAEFVYRGKRYMRGGFVDRDSARHWISQEHNRLRRGAVGYIKSMHKSRVLPLIEEYADHLRGRGRDAMYCYTSGRRLKRLAEDCAWLTLEHVTTESFAEWQKSVVTFHGKAIGNRTKNQYLDTASEWCAWLVRPRKILAHSPLADASRLAAKHNDEYRRAATIEELDKLLATCPADHRLYYTFRLYTPMRGRTVHNLTWAMMHLDAAHPFAQTPAELNKSRKPEKHPIRHEDAAELRAMKKRTKAKAADLVFPDPPTLDDLKADWKAAGVEFDRGGKHRLDFHAMRTTLVQIGKTAGIGPWQMMDLIGWKSMTTMMKHYSKLSIEPERSAVLTKLPAVGKMRRAQ